MASTSSLSLLRAIRSSQLRSSTGVYCTRRLSTTPSHGVRAVFGSTSDDALAQHLDMIQRTITLPAHLPESQRKLVFNPQKKLFLQQNPIDLEIEGLEHRFTAIDPTKDIPNSEAAFTKAIRMMQTQEDWANFETLLSGFRKSGRRLSEDHLWQAAGRAMHTQNIGAAIDAARHIDETGLAITNRMAHRVLLGIAMKAETDPAAATKWMNEVLDITSRKPHTVQKRVWKPHTTKLATGLGLYIRMAAVAGQDAESVKPRDLDALKDEAGRVQSIWENHFKYATEEQGVGLESGRQSLTIPHMSANDSVRLFAYNIKALEATPAVLGQAMETLDRAADVLKEYLAKFVTSTDEKIVISSRLPFYARTYKNVVGTAPSWAEPAADDAVLPPTKPSAPTS